MNIYRCTGWESGSVGAMDVPNAACWGPDRRVPWVVSSSTRRAGRAAPTWWWHQDCWFGSDPYASPLSAASQAWAMRAKGANRNVPGALTLSLRFN